MKSCFSLQTLQPFDKINSFSTLPKLYSAIKNFSLTVTRHYIIKRRLEGTIETEASASGSSSGTAYQLIYLCLGPNYVRVCWRDKKFFLALATGYKYTQKCLRPKAVLVSLWHFFFAAEVKSFYFKGWNSNSELRGWGDATFCLIEAEDT